jgi:drug/metabolite transporter (DMT)-like permease
LSEKLYGIAKKLIKYLVYVTIGCIISLSLVLLVLRAAGVEHNSLLEVEIVIITIVAVLTVYDYFWRWMAGEKIEFFPILFKGIGIMLLLFSILFFEASKYSGEAFEKIFLFAISVLLFIGGMIIIIRVTDYEHKER